MTMRCATGDRAGVVPIGEPPRTIESAVRCGHLGESAKSPNPALCAGGSKTSTQWNVSRLRRSRWA